MYFKVCKCFSIDWFLYDRDLRHERVNSVHLTQVSYVWRHQYKQIIHNSSNLNAPMQLNRGNCLIIYYFTNMNLLQDF